MTIRIFYFIFIFSGAFAQQKSNIDSINALPFEDKIKRASILDEVYLKNAENAKKIKYAYGEAASYGNLALVYYYQGKYNLNVSYALKSLKLYEELGALDKLAYEYGALGYSMKRRNMPKALYYMQKGKALAEQGRDTTAMLSIYNNYGVLKEMLHELDSALYFYKKGLVVKKNLNDSLGLPFSYNNIAGVYVMQNKFDAAEKLFEKALRIRQLRKDDIGIAENYTCFGDLYLAKKEYTKALDYYQKSVELASEYDYLYLVQSNYQSISKCYELLGNENAALANYKKYVQFKDSLLNKETNAKIAELDIRFETSQKEKQIAENRNLLLRQSAENQYKTNVLIALSFLSIFLLVTGYLIYRQQKLKNRQLAQEHELKNAITLVETQNKLQEQRLSISRDLHDNIGSQLTFIISSVDNIKYAFDIQNTKLDQKLQSISNFTKDTILELRDTIWAMNSNEITFENLLTRIANFIEKAQDASEEIQFYFEVEKSLQHVKLSSIIGINIYRTIQEAVNNAIKYSEAAVVKVEIQRRGAIEITIQDNGKGFDKSSFVPGNGLANMEKRVQDINGHLAIESAMGGGTMIAITLNTLVTTKNQPGAV